MLLFVNFILFQAGWFTCVLLGDRWAVVATLLIVAAHCYWVVRLSKRSVMSELQWIAAVSCCGLVLEALYFGSGLLLKVKGMQFPPLWLLCIWALFATTLRFSLAWLRSRLFLAAIFAFISAPSSYYAGAAISPTVDMARPLLLSLFFIGLTWFIVFPAILFFSASSTLGGNAK